MQDYKKIQPNQKTFLDKVLQNIWVILTISIINYTLSVAYSLILFHKQSRGLLILIGFISLLVSAVFSFFLSRSHICIYGVSILSLIYLGTLVQAYTPEQISIIVILSGGIILPFFKILVKLKQQDSFGQIFRFLPPKVHVSLIVGLGFILLAKFFPLAINNIPAFYKLSSFMTSPAQTINITFKYIDVYSLLYTIIILALMMYIRKKLILVPMIFFLALLGILINFRNTFYTYQNLCEGMDCQFYPYQIFILHIPSPNQILLLVPASIPLTLILLLQQFLCISEIRQRKKADDQRYIIQDQNALKDEDIVGNREFLVLGLSNCVIGKLNQQGVFGGLPVTINMFSTFENFFQKKKYRFSGTKVVGLVQVLLTYCYFSILRFAYDRIPLFILFCIITTPMMYYFACIYRQYWEHKYFILTMVLLTVFTHPVLSLTLGAFITIYDLSQLLLSYPSEVLIQTNHPSVVKTRDTKLFESIFKKEDQPIKKRIIPSEDDLPPYNIKQYVLYRFTGVISYLNFYAHQNEINLLVNKKKNTLQSDSIFYQKYCENFIFSFRYVHDIDDTSLNDFAKLVNKIKQVTKKKVLITGLHSNLIQKVQKHEQMRKIIQGQQRVIYRLYGKDLQ